MTELDHETIPIQAAVFRRLLQHLMQERSDLRERELDAVAGFSRARLADWYRDAAEARGITMTRDEAREAVYGMPETAWSTMHPGRPAPESPPPFAASRNPDPY